VADEARPSEQIREGLVNLAGDSAVKQALNLRCRQSSLGQHLPRVLSEWSGRLRLER